MKRGKWQDRAERLESIVIDISWMARRYATGRHTYAPGMYNDAIMSAIELGVKIRPDDIESPPTVFAEEPK